MTATKRPKADEKDVLTICRACGWDWNGRHPRSRCPDCEDTGPHVISVYDGPPEVEAFSGGFAWNH